MLYIFKIVSVLTFLRIVLLIAHFNCKNFANLVSTSLENWKDILQKEYPCEMERSINVIFVGDVEFSSCSLC